MKARIFTRARFSLFVDAAMCALMFWAGFDAMTRREWVASILSALVGVSAIFTLVSRRRERMRQDRSITERTSQQTSARFEELHMIPELGDPDVIFLECAFASLYGSAASRS